jgi:drug/metabolite transporter (DMT)-like permease
MVAVLLGFLLNHETISPYMLISLPLIIGGVLLMSWAKTATPAKATA